MLSGLLSWPVAIGVLAAGCVELHRRVIAHQQRARTTAFIQVLPRSWIGAGLLWTLLAWPLSFPLHWLSATAGTWALAAVGFVLFGLGGSPGVAIGAAVCYSIWRPDPDLIQYWAAPIVAGAVVNLINTGPSAWGPVAVRLREASRRVGAVRPPRPHDWFWLAAATLAALAPTGYVLWHHHPLWTVATAAAGVQLLAWVFDLRALIRSVRRWARMVVVAAVAAAVILARSPWTFPLPHGWAGGVALAVLAFTAWAIRHYLVERQSVPWNGTTPVLRRLFGWRRIVALLAGAVRLALGTGLLPLAIAVTQGSPSLVEAATVLAVAEALTLPLRRRDLHRSAEIASITRLLSQDPPWPSEELGAWLHDTYLSRTSPRDLAIYRLITLLCEAAQWSAAGNMIHGQGFMAGDIRLRFPLRGERALRWTDLAEQALSMVDAEVVPRLLDDDGPLPRWQHLARGQTAVTRAAVWAVTTQWLAAYEADPFSGSWVMPLPPIADSDYPDLTKSQAIMSSAAEMRQASAEFTAAGASVADRLARFNAAYLLASVGEPPHRVFAELGDPGGPEWWERLTAVIRASVAMRDSGDIVLGEPFDEALFTTIVADAAAELAEWPLDMLTELLSTVEVADRIVHAAAAQRVGLALTDVTDRST
ncbi:hypothetical protein [Dactylosporangium darangshiense]|uniref:Uncharacterized protein n=1 Tax=Dactylosporangium darangshiense TaxID=579108 RepID=A0ABP8DNH4_9ACTN